MVSPEELARARVVKARHEQELLQKANVVGIGVGIDDEDSEEFRPVLVVNVTHKVPWDELAPADRIPKELDGVPVEVEAVGRLRAHRRGG